MLSGVKVHILYITKKHTKNWINYAHLKTDHQNLWLIHGCFTTFSCHFFLSTTPDINIFHKTTKCCKTVIYQSRKFLWSRLMQRDLVKKIYLLLGGHDLDHVKLIKDWQKKNEIQLIFSLLCHDLKKNVIFEKKSLEVIEVKRWFSRSLRPNFIWFVPTV